MNITDRKFFYDGNQTEIISHAVTLIISEAYRAIADHGRFSLVLAGGNSPRLLYEKLAQGVTARQLEHYRLPVPDSCSRNKQTIHFLPPDTWLFQGDERCVPFDHPDSNFRMIRETLLLQSGISETHLFRMPAEEADAKRAARKYENSIRAFFCSEKNVQPVDFPVFDLILLGLGEDGHTASLFRENAEELQEKKRWVVAVNAPQAKPPGMRLTFTLPVINHARNVLFFTTGRKKGELAKKIFLEEKKDVPASLVEPDNGRLFWFVAQS
jgi:6-phosphogluconolactonase